MVGDCGHLELNRTPQDLDLDPYQLGVDDLSPKARKALYVLRSGVFSAFCCPTSEPRRLKAFADYINHVFYIDDISDGMMEKETGILVDVVMNALDYDEYTPSGDMPPEDTSAGKLTRE